MGDPARPPGDRDGIDEPVRKRPRKYCSYVNNDNDCSDAPRSSVYYWLKGVNHYLNERNHATSSSGSSDLDNGSIPSVNHSEEIESNENFGVNDDHISDPDHSVSPSSRGSEAVESTDLSNSFDDENSNSDLVESNFSCSESSQFQNAGDSETSRHTPEDDNPHGNSDIEPEDVPLLNIPNATEAENLEPNLLPENNVPSNTARLFQNLLHKIENDLNTPVDSGVLASKSEVILNALTFSTKYHDSFIQLEGLFKLLNTLFRKDVFPGSRYYLDKLFLRNIGFHYYFYCKYCFESFGEIDFFVTKVKKCPVCNKESIISDLNKASFFVIVDLPSQIEIILNDSDVVQCKLFNPSSVTERENVIKDVYDGTSYRKYVDSLDFSDGFTHLSMCFSDDGTPLYSSSNFSIWPIFLSVLELPPFLRMKKILLGGLWFGKGHANQELFLSPFVDHVKSLSTTGFEIKVNNVVRKMKVHVISCCADAPARASIQSIHQFNGFQGCNWCLHTGEILEYTVNTRIYPVLENPPEGRSAAEVFRDGQAVLEIRRKSAHINGVVGVSPLHRLAGTLDIVDGMIVEFLHLAARGITGQMTGAWFGEDGSHVDYYIGCPENVKRMNFLIEHLSGPKELRRAQRLIEDIPHWKAREYENWALYNSLPVIANFHEVKLPGSTFVCQKMPTKYVKHWALYVEAMHIILQTEVTHENLDKAHAMLTEFVAQVENLYGRKHMTYNMHILGHLCPNVKRWGQPWAISAYCFESMNGELKKVVHANRGVPLQIMRAISHKEVINILNAAAGTPFTRKFKEDILRNRIKSYTKVDGVTVLGKTKQFSPNDSELYVCTRPNSGILDVNSYAECERVVYKHCFFSNKPTLNSNPLWKTGNSCAALDNGERIFIRKMIFSLEEEKCFIIASRIQANPCTFMPHAHGRNRASALNSIRFIEGDVFLVPMFALKTVCVRIFFPQNLGHFIIDVPNIFNVN